MIRRPALLLIALTLAGAAFAAETQKFGDKVRVTPDQMRQLDIVPVEESVFRVTTSAIGQIAFNEDTSTVVLAPFAGRVTRVIARIGDNVKRGDPLLELDSAELVPPQNDFVSALTANAKARSALTLAETVEKRSRDLYEGKAVALKDLQAAQAALAAAQSDVRSAVTALDAARNRLRILGLTDDEIISLEEKGTIRRATPITAPIDGTVVARKVGPGQFVRSDPDQPLYTIADLSTMWLKAFVPETDIPFVRVGQDIEVNVSALPDRSFKARITVVGAASDAATRRIIVRSEIPNPEGALKAEMFASFKIATAPAETSPSVPIVAVIREADVASVWIEIEDKVFQRRLVKLGREQGDQLQIRDGLKVGEKVVGRGAVFIDNEWHQ